MSERHLRAIKPLGTFRAVETRDGVGLERDGETFFMANELSASDLDLWEVMFGDGIWMLATPADLQWGEKRPDS